MITRMERMELEKVSVEVSVENLATVFANMDAPAQAYFFQKVGEIMHTWDTGGRGRSLMQCHSIGREMKDSGYLEGMEVLHNMIDVMDE